MTNKQREEIIRHGFNLKRLYPQATDEPLTLCKRLHRIETKAHRIAELLCSDESYYNSKTEDEHDAVIDRLLDQVIAILGSGPEIFVNRDPRGYALKIPAEIMNELREQGFELHQDWGGYGIICPEF